MQVSLVESFEVIRRIGSTRESVDPHDATMRAKREVNRTVHMWLSVTTAEELKVRDSRPFGDGATWLMSSASIPESTLQPMSVATAHAHRSLHP